MCCNRDDVPGFRVSHPRGIPSEVSDVLRSAGGTGAAVYPYSHVATTVVIPNGRLSRYFREAVTSDPVVSDGGTVVPESRISTYGPQMDTIFADLIVGGRLPRDAESGSHSAGAPLYDLEVAAVNRTALHDATGRTIFAPAARLVVGDRIVIHHSRSRQAVTGTVVGVVEEPPFENYPSEGNGIQLITTSSALTSLRGRDEADLLFLRAADPHAVDDLRRSLVSLSLTFPDLVYLDMQEMSERMERDLAAVGIFFYGFVAVIVLIGLLNVANTVHVALHSRRRELSVLRSIGMDRYTYLSMMAAELLVPTVLAVVLGNLVGAGLWYTIVSIVSSVRGVAVGVPWSRMALATGGLVLAIMAIILGFTASAERIYREPPRWRA